MTDKMNKQNNEAEEKETLELNLEDLEQVTGGSIKNVQYTKTVEISADTKSKI